VNYTQACLAGEDNIACTFIGFVAGSQAIIAMTLRTDGAGNTSVNAELIGWPEQPDVTQPGSVDANPVNNFALSCINVVSGAGCPIFGILLGASGPVVVGCPK
jgi:hypothetical protein